MAVFCSMFFASSFLTIYFQPFILALFLSIFLLILLNSETKIDYLIKRQIQRTIFDYLLNNQK